MAVRIGVAFDGFVTTAEAVALAERAVDAGAQSLWVAEHLGYREAIGTCVAFALRTPGAGLRLPRRVGRLEPGVERVGDQLHVPVVTAADDGRDVEADHPIVKPSLLHVLHRRQHHLALLGAAHGR